MLILGTGIKSRGEWVTRVRFVPLAGEALGFGELLLLNLLQIFFDQFNQ